MPRAPAARAATRAEPGSETVCSSSKPATRPTDWPEPIIISIAPAGWSFDVVDHPHLPSWERVLDAAKAAGFGGLDLGPDGDTPLALARVSEALPVRGLAANQHYAAMTANQHYAAMTAKKAIN